MSMPPSGVVIRAHAKINLDLRVLGRRRDGYHDLRTVFQAVALHDTLVCVRRPGAFALDSPRPGIPLDERNLVWQAAAALWKWAGRTGTADGVSVRLEKRIPVQAGLGGGSSDAAAALVALARLWDLAVPADGLHDLASTLGSDVAFFLEGGTAVGGGRGEHLVRLADIGPVWVVLAQPPAGIPTADAYGWFDADRGLAPGERRDVMEAWAGLGDVSVNDLEAPVLARHPEIRLLKQRLIAAGAARAAMSGSGSAVFGLFDDRATADEARRGLAAEGFWSVLTRTLAGVEYARRSRARACRPA